MTFKRTWRRGSLFLMIGLLIVAALAACSAGGGTETGDEIPEVTIDLTGSGVSVPADVPSGIVAFKVKGEGDPMPARLNDGVTLDELNEALGQPDPFAAVALVTLLGGSSTTTDGRLIVDLQPGQHVVVNLPDDGPPSVSPFTAGDPSGATAPTADITVDLVDFNFAIPSEISTGPKVWQINNKGQQWHELAIVKLTEGLTIDDVMAMLTSEEAADDGPPPFEPVAFWSPSSAGETGWVTWDLAPGEYTVLCFLPDLIGDMSPHATHGMIANLTVTE